MKLEKFPPSGNLKPFIKNFLIIESANGMGNKILPDTSIVAAFRYRGNAGFQGDKVESRMSSSVITGIRKSPRLITYEKETAVFLIVFTEIGAAAFFNESLYEIHGISVSLDNLIGRSKLTEIEEKLADQKDNASRVSIIENFLLKELKQVQPHFFVSQAVQKIRSVKGNLKIKDLLTDLPVSRDSFEKNFRRTVGTSPKQFANIVRFRCVVNEFRTATRLTDLAQASGYFDQAHFIKDFSLFTGETPRQFFKSPVFW